MHHPVAVAAVFALACGTKSEPTEKQRPQPPSRSFTVDAATAAAPDSSLTPCVVRVELTPGGVTLAGGGISGGDVTALRNVAAKCTARLVASDDVTFEAVTKMVNLIAEQGIEEVRFGDLAGQWMSMDLGRVAKLWNVEPAARLIAIIQEEGPRLGEDNASIVEQVSSAIARGRQDEAVGKQTTDRGLFEAVAQIVGLRRATAPVALDLLERFVMPALRIDASAAPPSSGSLKGHTGAELFEMFVAHSGKRTDPTGRGLLGTIPDADLSTPYGDDKAIEVHDGDWVVVATAPLAARLERYDARQLVAQYDRFVDRLKSRDDDRVLVETAARALSDLRDCVDTAVKNRDTIVFRALPSPTVRPPGADDRNLPTVVITKTAISVKGASARQSLLSSLPTTSPRTIVIEADRSLPYGQIRTVAAAIGTPGHVTFVLRHR